MAALTLLMVPGPAMASDGLSLAQGSPSGIDLDPVVKFVCDILPLPLLCPDEPEPQEETPDEIATNPTPHAPTPAVPETDESVPPVPVVAPPAGSPSPEGATSPLSEAAAGPTTPAPAPFPAAEPAAEREPDVGSRSSGAVDSGPLALALPGDVDFSPTTVALAATVSIVGLILIGFPAELFNQTVRENYSSLKRLFPWIGRASGGTSVPWQIGALIVSSAVAGLIGSFQLIGSWIAGDALIVALGLGVGFLVTTAVYEGICAAVGVGFGMPVRVFRAYPGALPFVAVFVAISATGGLQPAYVYGHIAGSKFEGGEDVDLRELALQTAAGSAGVMVLALACWGLRAVVPQLAADMLAGITIVALNWLVFSLIPATFLEGEPLFRYRKGLWAALYVPALILFLLLVLVPATEQAGGGPIAVSVALFVLFAVVSVAVWGYFRSHRTQGALRR